MAKGDSVHVVVDTGDGTSKEYVIEADKNGRSVEVEHTRSGFVAVSVFPATRGKHKPRPVRRAEFAEGRIIALDEVHAEQAELPKEGVRQEGLGI